MKIGNRQLIITCEHAGNFIPVAFRKYLHENDPILFTHRGIDIGAMELATKLVIKFNCPFYFQNMSRLLIDCNRSLGNASLFSEYSKELPENLKSELLFDYQVYRDEVIQAISKKLEIGVEVLHLSIHTFTQNFYGVIRDGDIGVLFDPNRSSEMVLANRWINSLSKHLSELVIRPNYPYHGTDDGFTTYLREKFVDQYLGIELEVCQKWVDSTQWQNIITQVIHSLDQV